MAQDFPEPFLDLLAKRILFAPAMYAKNPKIGIFPTSTNEKIMSTNNQLFLKVPCPFREVKGIWKKISIGESCCPECWRAKIMVCFPNFFYILVINLIEIVLESAMVPGVFAPNFRLLQTNYSRALFYKSHICVEKYQG